MLGETIERLEMSGVTVINLGQDVSGLFAEVALLPIEIKSNIGFVFICATGTIRSPNAVNFALQYDVPVAFRHGVGVAGLSEWIGSVQIQDGKCILPGSNVLIDHMCVFLESVEDHDKLRMLERLFVAQPELCGILSVVFIITDERTVRLLASGLDGVKDSYLINWRSRGRRVLPHLS